jgi:riboflavin synthase
MFAGIIKDLGTVVSLVEQPFGCTICLRPDFNPETSLLSQIKIDDSVGVNGVCLTAVRIDQEQKCFWADVVHTTIEKSTIGTLRPGDRVHLELALKASDRLGGHIVQGHVQGTATVSQILDKGGNFDVTFEIPSNLMKYLVNEGPIVIDGVSLTVAKCIPKENAVIITIIPHTWKQTRFHEYQVGHKVNVETDLFAQYIQQFLEKMKETHA